MKETENTIDIVCINTGRTLKAKFGMTVKELMNQAGITIVKDPKTGIEYSILAALVDNKLKDLDYKLIFSQKIEFIGFNHPDGRRTYVRSLCFVLQKAIRELYPDKYLCIDHSLPVGLYCEIKEQKLDEQGKHPDYFIRDEELEKIKSIMCKYIDKDLPFIRKKMSIDEAEQIFLKNHQPDKARLFRSLGRFVCTVYSLGNQIDTFHGPLAPSTGCLQVFDITGFNEGFCLQLPPYGDFSKVVPMRRQSKIAASLKEYSDWCDVLGASGVGSLNQEILNGNAIKIINIAEALQERKYSAIADQIAAKKNHIKIVFIAGPSSSGKTSSSLRLALQCKVLGMNPKVIELDNYFVDRAHTPKDENGEYDFEALKAMDIDFLNKQLNDLLDGKEIEIPQYDFKTGERKFTGKTMSLEDKDILIMEGIHALNPEMVPFVDQTKVFRVYVSALTSLNLDENNNISTSDNRLLRRMVRDNRTRGINPEETIMRWNSVRRGEDRNIFPFQENADALFNSALLYELPLLKYFAEPLLRRIQPNSPAFCEAVRLLKFLDFIIELQPSEIQAIPPTSIIREFIGGQTL